MKKKTVLLFRYTTEAIKMCPLVKALQKETGLRTVVCVTGQHREMLAQVLDAFQVTPDYDLAIMKQDQTLFDITSGDSLRINRVLDEVQPDLALVHGDTTTTFATTLASFTSDYRGARGCRSADV